jgi:MFS family permease
VTSVAFGFIRNFHQAVFLRVIEGAVNGNTAIIRTMVSEVVEERRYVYPGLGRRRRMLFSHEICSFQTKAFILMPMCYNVAVIVSPMMAGLLANLAESYPKYFGENPFLRRFPYAPPAIASGLVVLFALLLVFFCLREVCDPISRLSPSLCTNKSNTT